ncbi:MAG: glycosyltransferase [Pseudomonadota bacterium]
MNVPAEAPQKSACSEHRTAPLALVVGTFPPITGPASDTSLAAIAALLATGHRVETVSLSGHGDAHLALDFAKAYALRRFRTALRRGPKPAAIIVVPGALRMRRPNTAARLLALVAQVYTLLWLGRRSTRFMLADCGEGAGGWRPAARLIGPLLRLVARPFSTADYPGSKTAALLIAAAWRDRHEGRIAASLAALLDDRTIAQTVATLAKAAAEPAQNPPSRALAAATAPCPRWSTDAQPVAAWMGQLRAARGALQGLAHPRAAPACLDAERQAIEVRRWALAELDGDAGLAGMAATLRSTGNLSQTAAETAESSADATAHRAWTAVSRATLLRSPLIPAAPPEKALTEALHQQMARIPATFPASTRQSDRAASPPTRRADRLDDLTDLGLAVAIVAGLPGGMPEPGKPLPERLRHHLQAVERALATGPSPVDLALAQTSNRGWRSAEEAPPDATIGRDEEEAITLVGHGRQDMGLGANLSMSAAALAHAGIQTTALSADNGLEPISSGAARQLPGPRRLLHRAVTLLHLNADRVPPALLHRRLNPHQANARPGSEPLAIGFLLWEFDRLPEAHRLAVEMLDEIWAPTPFVADVYRAAAEQAGTGLTVIGKAVPDGPLASLARRDFELPEHAFLFLSSFDFHSSIERKNPLALVRAFEDAFPLRATSSRDVGLVLKTTEILRGHWGDPHGQWATIEEAAARDPRIRIVTGRLAAADYRALIAVADAYVSPHRSEGFGYGPAEAMLRERPVIATDWSGTQAFCTQHTSFPVPCRAVPVRPTETILPVPGAHWAEIDHDALVATLLQVATDPLERQRRAAAGAALIRGTYGLDAHAARMTERLEALGALEKSPAVLRPTDGRSAA